MEGDEVLAGTSGGAGNDGGFKRLAVVEMGETKRGGVVVGIVEEWEFQIFGGGGCEDEDMEEKRE